MEQIIGELINAGKIIVINKYKDNTRVKEKLFHLELLVLKLNSAVEVGRMVPEPKPQLLRWMETFEETAKQGADILREFRDRAERQREAEIRARDQGAAESSSYASSPSNVAKRIRRWISGDPQVQRLNETITMLERASADIKAFLKMVKLRFRFEVCSTRKSWQPTCPLSPDFAVVTPSGRIRRERECLNAKAGEDRVEELLTWLSICVEEIEMKSIINPSLVTWRAKMREAVIEGHHELNTIKRFPEFRNRCGNLAERFERMIADLEEFWMIMDTEQYVHDEVSELSRFLSSMDSFTNRTKPTKTGTNSSPNAYHHSDSSSPTELLSSAKLLAGAATSAFQKGGKKVETAQAADQLLHAASQYGHLEEKSFGKYIETAEGYLHKYAGPQTNQSKPSKFNKNQEYDQEYDQEEEYERPKPTKQTGNLKKQQYENEEYEKPVNHASGKVKKHESEYENEEYEKPVNHASSKVKKHESEYENEDENEGGIGNYVKMAQGFMKKQDGRAFW